VFSFYFVLFGASATDVLANYLSISLNVVLTSFRFLAIAVPLIVYPVTYRICKEMQSVPTAGKRKRANVVLRSAEGGYSTVRAEERPGDAIPRVDPLPLDQDLQFVPAMAGVLVAGDSSSAGDGGSAGEGGSGEVQPSPAEVHSGRPRGGIFRIPRDYR
jgi:ubiquinol-cytochrome c reductase cytochrome b subunit